MEGSILPSREESCRLGAKDEGKDRTGEGKGKGALCRSQGGFGKSLVLNFGRWEIYLGCSQE
jgi:hypothetical protein